MKEGDIDFGTLKVSVLFKKLFFPTLFGMLGISAMTAIDGIFIGHSVGSDGIAAVNIVIPVQMLLTGIGLMIGAGCSVIASLCLAHGRQRMAQINVTQAMLAVSVIAFLIMAWMLFDPETTARQLGSSEHLLPMVVDYMVCAIMGFLGMDFGRIVCHTS